MSLSSSGFWGQPFSRFLTSAEAKREVRIMNLAEGEIKPQLCGCPYVSNLATAIKSHSPFAFIKTKLHECWQQISFEETVKNCTRSYGYLVTEMKLVYRPLNLV